jgi:RNA polymerase sigma-70 factor (ECF subfamily)
MGSLACSARPRAAYLDWSQLEADQKVKIEAAGGPDRRLSSDSNGSASGRPGAKVEEVGQVTGTDAETDGVIEKETAEQQYESSAERNARFERDALTFLRPDVLCRAAYDA